MGVCGTAMGNVALLARAAGHEVSGADNGVYPPMSHVLAEAGIVVHEGYDAERLARLAPDCVVIGNAMSRGNPEVEWLLDSRALPFTSLPALLHDLVLRHRRNIVVCGTHGKTTTTALTAFLLRENHLDPGFLIGGVPIDPPVGNHLGSPDAPFVIEGDEYDSAFFDKRSKFIHYAPQIAVFNNLEFDHADIFRDLADVKRTFLHLARIVPRKGWIVMNGDDVNLRALGGLEWTQIIRVGTAEENEVRIKEFRESAEGSVFELTWFGERWERIAWKLAGLYNARNAAMAATAAVLALGGMSPQSGTPEACRDLVRTTGIDLRSLARFRGVKRRQEVLWSGPRISVIEDFGHHPTALGETLVSLRNRYPDARLTAVFEPRSNTARTNVLQEDFMTALGRADEVYLGSVNRADKLPATGRFDGGSVAAFLAGRGVKSVTAASNPELLEKLVQDTLADPAPSRVVVFFSNGSFDGIIAKYAAAARSAGGA